MFKLDLEKAEEPEIKLPISIGSSRKQECSKKVSTFAILICQSLWLCRPQQTGKFLKKLECKTTWFAPWEIYLQVKKQQLELHMEQHTGSKSEKEYVKAVYCHPACFTFMQSTSWEMPGWMKHKLESRLPREISVTSDMQMTLPIWQKGKKNQRASW